MSPATLTTNLALARLPIWSSRIQLARLTLSSINQCPTVKPRCMTRAMSTSEPKDLTDFLRASFPTAVPSTISASDITHLSHELYPNTSYTDSEKVEISTWLTSSSHLAAPDEDEAKHIERLGSLNRQLSTNTTILGSKPSVADLALFCRLVPIVKRWSAEERTGEKGYHHIVRYMDFVQNAPIFGLSLKPEEKVPIDTSDIRFIHKPKDPREEKERRKKEKAAAAAVAAGTATEDGQRTLTVGRGKEESNVQAKSEAQQNSNPGASTNGAGSAHPPPKKEKKEKAPKQPKAATAPATLSPHLIDLRVGHILKAIPHPDADSLYVSTIACGDPPGTENTSDHEGKVVRTVCSGLNGLVPLEEMQGRKIVAVCNLKPVKMRGITSAAMVLAASPRLALGEEDHHSGPVELVDPPEGASAGERACFEGWEGEPEGQLNPKKKLFETLQPGLTTDEEGRVAFDPQGIESLKSEGKSVGLLRTQSGGLCKVKSLKGATVR